MRRVLFLHPWVSSLKEMVDYLSLSDDIMRQAVWDERNPELVFVSEHVFYKPEYMRKVRSLYKDGRVFAFHGGEAIYPDLNVFDYAVVYSRYLNEADRIIGLPEQVVFKSVGFGKNDYDEGQALKSLQDREFCSFIYSNGSAHPMRDRAFYRLSEYKQVASLGRHLNNSGGVQDGDEKRDYSSQFAKGIEMKGRYKFTIAFENAIFPGYTSEKLLTSFRAHTVPVYWGNPRVSDYYNPAAFINCHDYANLDEVAKRVEEIDRDDRKWAEMVTQPWQTREQEERSARNLAQYYAFIERLMTEDVGDLIRRPAGSHPELYRQWFFRDYYLSSYYSRAVRKLKRVFKRK